MADVEAEGRRRALLKLALLLALVAAGFLLARLTPVGDYLSLNGIGRAVNLLRGFALAPVIFVLVYTVATALAIPGSVLTLAGGALFGTLWGTVFNSLGANLGANAAFVLSRFLGRDGVERLMGDRLERLDRAARDHGFRGLLVLRLVPLVPFNALNFGSGLTAMSWPVYALATVVGILPGTIVYTMFADALLQGSQEASREALVRVLVSGGLLVLLSFLPTILKKLNVRLPGPGGATGLAVALGAFAVAGPAGASPGLSPSWRQATLPDHEAFTAVLQEVVQGSSVDYRKLQEHRTALDGYLNRMAAVDPGALASADENARLAFWINAYNACMLKLVADHYPIRKNTSLLERVKNSAAGRPENSVWQIEDVFTREHCRVAGEARSQDEIEHEIIRPMGEPRIHFAVNCAAVSCPALAEEAYTARELDRQLDRQVERFLEDDRHFRIEEATERVTIRVNKVLEWYGDDFGGEAGVKAFLAPYLSGPRRGLVRQAETDVAYFEYDWTLNDVRR